MGCAGSKGTQVKPAAAPVSTPAPSSTAPHQGDSLGGAGAIEQLASLFGKKHAIISYQWEVQEEVKQARDLLKAAGVPTWMDIDGGMQTDIYDSMAEGVGNAAVCIPFMTKKYSESKNCQLELKFAVQTGVAIVPVMMESGFTPSGWLGLLTAGNLWTPLHDPASFQENIEGLLRQIKLAVASGAGADDEVQTVDQDKLDTAPEFSAQELRDELSRLKSDNEPVVAGMTPESGRAKLPAAVPDLPQGLMVSKGMEELLHQLTGSTSGTRIGFWGMGGIGKTTISSWIVRQDSVRDMFEQIVWISLGQTPTLLNLQSLLLLQLNGDVFTGDEPEEQRIQILQHEMTGKKLLLVLDDVWDAAHEKVLNFADEESGSKVLVSSRVRQVLESSRSESSRQLLSEEEQKASTVVTIELPCEDDAVKMLLSTAGLSVDGDVPAEAHELARFCKLLPLSLSIAGALVREFGIGLEPEEWHDIVAVMKEEFAENDGERSVEESVIAASIKSIKGVQKQSVEHLFKTLALVPEDTVVPLEIIAMMYESVPQSAGGPTKRPSVLNTRRWLKQLIDRSLVLGTVDCIQLHDIVREYVMKQHSGDDLRQSHARLVDAFRAARPLDVATGHREWNSSIDTPMSRYVRDFCAVHIRDGWQADWESDDHACGWLSDFPEDHIVAAAGSVLGLEKLTKLADSKAEEKWEFAKLASVAGKRARGEAGLEASVQWERKAMDALAELNADETTERCEDEERLTLEVGIRVLGSQQQEDLAKYLARVVEVSQGPTGDKHLDLKAYSYFFQSNVMLLMGQPGEHGHEFAEVWLIFVETAAKAASTHSNEAFRVLMQQIVLTGSPWELCVRHKQRFSYDALYGEGGELLQQAVRSYNYGTHHKKMIELCLGCDVGICVGVASTHLATHYGDLVSANLWMDRCMEFLDRVLAERDRMHQGFTLLLFSYWGVYSVRLGREKQYLAAISKAEITWSTADDFVDQIAASGIRPRGDTTMGQHVMTAEHCSWMYKLTWIMASPDPGITAQEFADALPTFDQVLTMSNAGLPHAYMNLVNDHFNLVALIAEACEKMGLYEQGLDFAEKAASNIDITQGGSFMPSVQWRGYRTKGRCLVAMGKPEEAEAAFELALSSIKGFEYFLLEALCLRDLKVLVLDQNGRSAEGATRLKAAICMLLGDAPVTEQLIELKASLGDAIDLSAMFA